MIEQGGIFLRSILVAAPRESASLPSFRHTFAHLAYTADGGELLRSEAFDTGTRGGILGFFCRAEELPCSDGFCRALLQECRARGYEGVLADVSGLRTSKSSSALERLAEALLREGMRLYVPLPHAVSGAHILVCSALSGGTLEEHLAECAARFGAAKLALDCQRLLMDFTLPCRRGEGRPLTIKECEHLRIRVGSPVFFSRELCCNYFSYCAEGKAHFVAFDTAETLRRKMALAEHLGISTAFFTYPEVCDLLGELF